MKENITIKGFGQAIKYYWLKTLVSNTRLLVVFFVVNYVVTMALNIMGMFKFTWEYMAFLAITATILGFFTGILKAKPIDIEIDLGNK